MRVSIVAAAIAFQLSSMAVGQDDVRAAYETTCKGKELSAAMHEVCADMKRRIETGGSKKPAQVSDTADVARQTDLLIAASLRYERMHTPADLRRPANTKAPFHEPVECAVFEPGKYMRILHNECGVPVQVLYCFTQKGRACRYQYASPILDVGQAMPVPAPDGGKLISFTVCDMRQAGKPCITDQVGEMVGR